MAWFELALALGMPVAEAQRRVSSAEFVEWLAFQTIYGPLGPNRGDYHAAQLESSMVNIWRGKSQRAVGLGECLLQWGKKKKQTAREMITIAKDWLLRSGAIKGK